MSCMLRTTRRVACPNSCQNKKLLGDHVKGTQKESTLGRTREPCPGVESLIRSLLTWSSNWTSQDRFAWLRCLEQYTSCPLGWAYQSIINIGSVCQNPRRVRLLLSTFLSLLSCFPCVLDQVLNYTFKGLPLRNLLISSRLPVFKDRIRRALKSLKTRYMRLQLLVRHTIQCLVRRRAQLPRCHQVKLGRRRLTSLACRRRTSATGRVRVTGLGRLGRVRCAAARPS